jgi:hypothetical protein
MFLSMIQQHTSIVVFTIAPFSPDTVYADINMSGNNRDNNLAVNLHVNTNSRNHCTCACNNFDLNNAVLSCRSCQSQPTPRQIFDAQKRRDDQVTAANNARDEAMDLRDVALAQLEEARATIFQLEATILERDATMQLVVTQRDENYRYVMRALYHEVMAANNERDRVIGQRDTIHGQLGAANARIEDLERMLGMRG